MGKKKEGYKELQCVELAYIYDTISRIQDRRVQVFAFFGTASLSALGLTIQQQKTGLMLISILFILLYLGAEGTARAEMAPYFLRGYLIEKKQKGKIDILSSYMAIVEQHLNLKDDFDNILKITDEEERIKEVNRIFYNPFKLKKATTLMAIGAIIIEIVIFMFLHLFVHWPFI